MSSNEPFIPGIARYFKAVMRVAEDRSTSASMALRPDLVDPGGALRLGAALYLVDVATGICSGLSVVDRGLWIVTTDLQLEMVTPVTRGPLRVEARVARTGATTVVCEYRLVDESSGDVVGGGTTTNRPFPFEGGPDLLRFPPGVEIVHDDGTPVGDGSVAEQLGIGVDADGVAEIEVADRLRNPWGILHGGVTGLLFDLAADAVASGLVPTDARPMAATIRYLSPGRVGPVQATPTMLANGDRTALVSVAVRDTGRDDRLMSVGTVTVR